jgi:hypothetical protein
MLSVDLPECLKILCPLARDHHRNQQTQDAFQIILELVEGCFEAFVWLQTAGKMVS